MRLRGAECEHADKHGSAGEAGETAVLNRLFLVHVYRDTGGPGHISRP